MIRLGPAREPWGTPRPHHYLTSSSSKNKQTSIAKLQHCFRGMGEERGFTFLSKILLAHSTSIIWCAKYFVQDCSLAGNCPGAFFPPRESSRGIFSSPGVDSGDTSLAGVIPASVYLPGNCAGDRGIFSEGSFPVENKTVGTNPLSD